MMTFEISVFRPRTEFGIFKVEAGSLEEARKAVEALIESGAQPEPNAGDTVDGWELDDE